MAQSTDLHWAGGGDLQHPMCQPSRTFRSHQGNAWIGALLHEQECSGRSRFDAETRLALDLLRSKASAVPPIPC